MAGTKAGGAKAAAKNLAKDPDFYKKIGSRGGSNGTTGGFASTKLCHCNLIRLSHRKAQCAGLKGGRISRRRPKTYMEYLIENDLDVKNS